MDKATARFALLLLLTAPLLAPPAACAQEEHLLIGGGGNLSGGLGYAPGAYVEVAPEFMLGRVLMFPRAAWSWADKLDAGDGGTATVRAEAFYPLRRLLIGGGALFSQTWTSAYAKRATHPLLGVGYQGHDLHTRVLFMFRGTDHQNGLQGLTARLESRLTPRLWLVADPGLFRFHQTGDPTRRRTGVQLKFGLLYALF